MPTKRAARPLVFAALLVSCVDPSRQAPAFDPHAASPPAAASRSAAARTDEARARVPIDAAYTRDVWVVVTPPLAIHLLSRFDEAADDGGADFDCEKALVRHARGLGANRLYIDHAAACRGAAYFVPPPRGPAVMDSPDAHDATPATEAPLRTTRESGAAGRYSVALRDWILTRWHRPSGMSEAESRRLCVVVQFSTSDQLRIWNVRAVPILSSGDRAFDASVRDALESAIDAHAALPDPQTPEEARSMRRAQVRFAFSEGNVAGCR